MKIHFIGIGGIGVSALAKYYLAKGHKVSGSDLVSSEITQALKKQGAKIYTPHQNKFGAGQVGKHFAKNVPKDADLVVYSPAVKSSNPELLKAKKYKITTKSYPEALGELTKKYFTIAVSGTHGKSTTTAMISLILIKAGFDPTVIIGTKLKEFSAQGGLASGEGNNFRAGNSRYLVIEADEWNASFLNYWPKIIVLTNIEKEHLDYYKNLNNVLKTYREYISHLPKEGVLIVNKEDKNIKKILSSKYNTFPTVVENMLYYSPGQKEAKKIKRILKIPGQHNVLNALAALAVARVLKIPDKISFEALSKYKGAWRRFEITEIKNPKLLPTGQAGYTLISDYGHHPTEIKATLNAAREKFPKRKIWLVFQPHQYQRTFYLFDDFVKVFKEALAKKFAWAHSYCRSPKGGGALFACDKIIITDIYDVAGRENKEIKKKVNSEKLVKAIKKPQVIYLPQRKIKNYLKKNLKSEQVLIIMGAGDIYELSRQLAKI